MTDEAMKKLTGHILLALLLGVGCGGLLQLLPQGFVGLAFIEACLIIVANSFISALKMIVVPMVFFSIVSGVASLEGTQTLGRMGWKTFILYTLTTVIAISMALGIAKVSGIGIGLKMVHLAEPSLATPPGVVEVLSQMIPSNPIQAAANGRMLQLIVFSLFLGTAISASGAPGRRIAKNMDDFLSVMMKLINLIFYFAPYGVFALVTRAFYQVGFGVLSSLMSYCLVVFVVLVLQALFTYTSLLWCVGLNPLLFFKKMKPVGLFAMSTASSNATLPMTMEAVTHDLGVEPSVASFTLPLGATMNMDGTAIMQGVATVFLAHAYGIDLSLMDYVNVIMMATLASIGTAAVPGVGLVTLAMVLKQVGIPAEGIGMILGVDRLLDMLRTALNVCGDAVVSCVIAKSEFKMNTDCYHS
ncbi:MAG: dicarboxylate/amino acid:cation symporter [Oligoflexales bacterium]